MRVDFQLGEDGGLARGPEHHGSASVGGKSTRLDRVVLETAWLA